MKNPILGAFIFCLLLTAYTVTALKIPFGYQVETGNKTWSEGHAMGIFAPQEAPLWAPPGNGQAYIDFDMFVTSSSSTPPVLHAVTFTIADLSNGAIGARSESNEYKLCNDGFLLTTNKSATVQYRSFTIEHEAQHLKTRFDIQSSNVYYMMLVKCDFISTTLTFNGTIVAMNPFGHLQGEYYGMLPMSAILAVLYIVSGALWIFLLIKYRQSVMTVQHCISGVLLLCFLETSAQFLSGLHENNYGEKSFILLTSSLLFTLARKTVSRLLVLVVCMGYGVSRPKLGDMASKVLVFGAVYFILCCVFEIGKVLYLGSAIGMTALLFATAPVALMDGVCFAWIYMAITKTMNDLKERNQQAKLDQYKKFFRFIFGYAVACFLFTLFESFYRTSGLSSTYWNWLWATESFWPVSFFFVFAAIQVLWRPSAHSMLYAYVEELNQDEELPSMAGGEHDNYDENTGELEIDATEMVDTTNANLQFDETHQTTAFAQFDDDDDDDHFHESSMSPAFSPSSTQRQQPSATTSPNQPRTFSLVDDDDH